MIHGSELHRQLEDLKTTGQTKWSQLGYPSPTHESWRYTSLKSLMDTSFVAANAHDAEGAKEFVKAAAFRGQEIVFLNGRYAPALSDTRFLPEGVWLAPWHEIAGRSMSEPTKESLKKLIAQVGKTSDENFTALNQAHLDGGLLLVIEPEVILTEPIHFLYVSSPRHGGRNEATMFHPRTWMIVGQESQATVLESHWGENLSPTYWHNTVSDIRLEESAQLHLCKVQCEELGSYHVSSHYVVQENFSRFDAFQVSLGSKLARHNFIVDVAGEQAMTTLTGLYMGRDQQHLDHSVKVRHVGPQSVSRQRFKGILQDRARGVFRGQIRIEPTGQMTDSSQLNNNLLLSSQAEVDTLPQLEVFADNVKATHGATVGQLSEEEIFYLQSRGIDREQAYQMALRGFSEDLLEQLHHPAVRFHVQGWIEQAIARLQVKG